MSRWKRSGSTYDDVRKGVHGKEKRKRKGRELRFQIQKNDSIRALFSLAPCFALLWAGLPAKAAGFSASSAGFEWQVPLKTKIPGPGPAVVEEVESMAIHRLYNPNSGEHFYTASMEEKEHLVSLGWKPEGIGWFAPVTGLPVYRLYNPNAGDHQYTMNSKERTFLMEKGWIDEGDGWYCDMYERIPLYRLYNPNAKAGTHHYTVDKSESDFLTALGWKPEGIGWYGVLPEESPAEKENR